MRLSRISTGISSPQHCGWARRRRGNNATDDRLAFDFDPGPRKPPRSCTGGEQRHKQADDSQGHERVVPASDALNYQQAASRRSAQRNH